jgi:hypothetical protein
VWSIKVHAIVLPLTKFVNSVTFSPANRSHSHAPLEPLRLRVLDDGMKDDGMKPN